MWNAMKTLDFDKVGITDIEMTNCVPSVVVEGVTIIPGSFQHFHPSSSAAKCKNSCRFPLTRNRIEAT